MAFVPILPLFALELMGDGSRVNSFTGLVIGCGASAAAISAVWIGRTGDRTGHRRMILVCTLAGFAAFLLQACTTEGWQFLLLHLGAGVAHGGILTGVGALLARYTQHGEEGAVYGLDNSINSGARAIAPMVGVAIAIGFGYRAAFGAISVLYLSAFMAALWGLPRGTAAVARERRAA
jgi:DHA1 family multidrug resistance protein-like MFS transporter